jgi:ATP-dependent helicase/nuclease subunit A
MQQPSLFDAPDDPSPAAPPDQAARSFAIDPDNDVVLEASAGTGKTRVLVDRYARLIETGVDPRHILAITFTRKAAAEMRDRVLDELRRRAGRGAIAPDAWRALRDRVADIQISTIDAFCFGLLREFPLEADVDPAFEIADETEMGRFTNEALDLTLRAARTFIADDEHVRLLFARVKGPALGEAIRSFIDRRQVALPAVSRFVARHARAADATDAARGFVRRLRDVLRTSPYRTALLDDGPMASAEFRWLHADLAALETQPPETPPAAQQLRRRCERYFLTREGKPRQRITKPFTANLFSSAEARRRHEQAVQAIAPGVVDALARLDADIDGLLARGVLRLLTVAAAIYERLLAEHALLDFAGMLARSVALLEQQEEFARSRLKLQSRYHHLLVDEFQDTSRLQWRLIELLVDAWGEGEGAADAPTSIFVVGDRKQSIYRFRHAEVTLLDEAARKIGALRPGRRVRQAIRTSFRAVPELLAFVNAVSHQMQIPSTLEERFIYGDTDRFPVEAVGADALRDGEPVLGLIAEPTMERCAAALADEVTRLLATAVVRDRTSGTRAARPDDIAILFRSRAGHQYFEAALETRGVRTYVYKGLGFFDAPEVQDLQALLRYLAEPDSDLRAAEFLRSRFVRLSDVALVRLAPGFARALSVSSNHVEAPALDDLDRAILARARQDVARWLPLVARLTPGELVDLILRESGYLFELRGRRLEQARENLKKVRALIRRVENRGYATLGRLAAYFETLGTGDESNAIVEAAGAVNLMTIHAAKGLEFPIVFLVNLHAPGRGRSGGFTLVERGPAGEPEVAFGSNETTRLEDAREMEELRRLLYVAMTRACDRLYLSAVLDAKGRLRRPHRSLGQLLPAGLGEAFASAASGGDRVRWTAPDGTFALRVCRPLDGASDSSDQPAPTEASTTFDLSPLQTVDRLVVAATASGAADEGEPGAATPAPDREPGDRVVGTLVHRLFQRALRAGLPAASVADLARQLIRPEDLVDAESPDAVVERAASLYHRLRARPDVAETLASGRCLYEVPFSYEPEDRPGELVRGVVDCLVISPGGPPLLLEFKTGSPRPEHGDQARLYARAVEAALGRGPVSIKIIYP